MRQDTYCSLCCLEYYEALGFDEDIFCGSLKSSEPNLRGITDVERALVSSDCGSTADERLGEHRVGDVGMSIDDGITDGGALNHTVGANRDMRANDG